MELGDGAEIASAVMRNHSLVVRLGQGRNLAKAGDAVGHHDIGLQNGEDILFQHPAVFVHATIVFSPGDGNGYPAAQLGQLIESVARPRFFQPDAVQALEFPRGLQRADGNPTSRPAANVPKDWAWLASTMMSMSSPTALRTASTSCTSSFNVW